MQNPGFGRTQAGGVTTGFVTSAGPTATEDPSTDTQTSDSAGGQTTATSGVTGPTSATDDDPTTPTTAGTDDTNNSADADGSTVTDSSPTTDTDETDTDETDTDDSDTDTTDGMGEVVDATFEDVTTAKCVLLPQDGAPYAGPPQCETIVSNLLGEAKGVILNDEALFGGGGGNREARMFVRIDWPNDLTGKQLVTLALELRAAGDADSSGEIWLSQSFTDQSLGVMAADPIIQLLPSIGQIEAEKAQVFDLDPNLWEPQTSLYLVFIPDSPVGSFYYGSETMLPAYKPKIHVSYY